MAPRSRPFQPPKFPCGPRKGFSLRNTMHRNSGLSVGGKARGRSRHPGDGAPDEVFAVQGVDAAGGEAFIAFGAFGDGHVHRLGLLGRVHLEGPDVDLAVAELGGEMVAGDVQLDLARPVMKFQTPWSRSRSLAAAASFTSASYNSALMVNHSSGGRKPIIFRPRLARRPGGEGQRRPETLLLADKRAWSRRGKARRRVRPIT